MICLLMGDRLYTQRIRANDDQRVGGVMLPMEVKPTEDFLDPELAKSFRKVINSSPIFLEADEQKHRYNLICTVMDRLDSAVLFLNAHEEPPKTEEDLVCFLVYSCIARDAVYKLYQSIFQKRPSTINNKRFVLSVSTHSKRAFTETRSQRMMSFLTTFVRWHLLIHLTQARVEEQSEHL